MSIDTQGGEFLKPETQEILKELEAEGHVIEGQEPKVEEPKTPAEPVAEPKEEAKAEPEVEKPEKVDRKVQAVPVNKFNEERHKRQEAEERARIAEEKLKTSTIEVTGDVAEVAKQFAEKHGLDVELAQDLFTTASKLTPQNSGLSQEEIQELRSYKAQLQEQAEIKAFEDDFATVSKTLAEQGIDLAGHKDKIKELAYTEGYEKAPLRAIALEYAHDNNLKPGRKTVESSTHGRATATETIDFDSLSEEQAKALPDDQWEKYVEHQIKKQQAAQGNK